VKALNALGARLAVPHDFVRLKLIDDQELTLQNFRFQFIHSKELNVSSSLCANF
jgi:hypothetical protein